MKRSEKKHRARTQGEPEKVSSTAPRLPRALYTTGFDELASRWFKNPKAPSKLAPAVILGAAAETLHVSEALLLSPAVCCHVYGENVPLCLLIRIFGVEGVEQLLEESSLQFLLWRPMVLYWPLEQKQKITGIDPLAAGNHSDPAHSDPQASVEMGLRGWSGLPWAKLERLAKLAAERTHLPAANVPHDAIGAVRSAYDGGALQRFGFDKNKSREKLDDAGRKRLSGLAEDIAKGIVLYDMEFDLHESDWAWRQLLRFGEIVNDSGVFEAVEKGLILEHLPSIPRLLAQNIITPQDVVRLRNDPATLEFRQWLWGQPNPRDAEAVAKAWLASIHGKPLKDRVWFKHVRLSTFSALGGIVGTAIGSPEGLVAGTLVGAALNQTLGAVDTFGLEKMLSKPSPRRFADLLRRKVAKHAADGMSDAPRKQRRAKAAKQRKVKK
ncbi:hypothetical protein predicted by Glimmer/Critica [Sorangium cellulosum So ce56]|uniref:Uncharacterized protein n=1 Tax=Sorangium cellulosum (strain So ce56) TaxID=448385 RepID=A9GJI3_SORC5|nr:hypothetical protein [Sorangium cellulosum]CAN96446.1 hypothetical protein predicted by Glimmer/Critica [Sorangium cellulosum So ce56]